MTNQLNIDKESQVVFDNSTHPLFLYNLPEDTTHSSNTSSARISTELLVSELNFTESPNSQDIGEFSFKRQLSPSSAERRAEHNAVERARRECLNSKFQKLAETLPNLHTYRRPSKGKIVEKALDYIVQSRRREEQYQQEIKQLQYENKRLSSSFNPQETYNSTPGTINEIDYFSKECYPNSNRDHLSSRVTYSETTLHESWVPPSDRMNCSTSKDLSTYTIDQNKPDTRGLYDFKESIGPLDYSLMDTDLNSGPSCTKEHHFSVCSHPSNHPFNLTYCYPPYLS
ncbi:hypothetical protein BY458DRAFT_492638 [Sporodiniella umbellata]|nr:hypothetical protein BY458DRAFT_492638 [Sporodiniella umbellata]